MPQFVLLGEASNLGLKLRSTYRWIYVRDFDTYQSMSKRNVSKIIKIGVEKYNMI